MSEHSVAPVVIDVQDVSKKFARDLKKSMVFGLADISKAVLIPERFRSPYLAARISDRHRIREALSMNPRPPVSDQVSLRPSEFWALKNINFQVRQGDGFGVIGHNGAGKSTLFSLLSGIYAPTTGRIDVRGRLLALIALGAGFHPLLTGRENVYINASILGENKQNIDAVFDQIVEFAELEDFIDAPIKNYSSGMLVRLGFSVAAHLDPDILLIDEVLAVGDANFRQKCHRYVKTLQERDKTFIVVSHWMGNIHSLCSRVIWIDHGEIKMDGPTFEVVEAYNEAMSKKGAEDAKGLLQRNILVYTAYFNKIEMIDKTGAAVDKISGDEPCTIALHCTSQQSFPRSRVIVRIHDSFNNEITGASMFLDGQSVDIKKGENSIHLHFPELPLVPGHYTVTVGLMNENSTIWYAEEFRSMPKFISGSHHKCISPAPDFESNLTNTPSAVKLPYEWRIK